MLRIRLKFRNEAFWLVAAGIILTLEIYAAAGRERGWVTARRDAGASGPPTVAPEVRTIGVTSFPATGAILVVGNPGTELDREVEVVLRATRIPPLGARRDVPSAACADSCPSRCQPPVEQSSVMKPVLTSEVTSTAEFTELNRVYFLQTRMNAPSGDDGQTAIPCSLRSETARVRIFADRRLRSSSQLTALVDAVAEAAESDLGDVVEELAGRVCDVDHDGHLAIVITPEVAQVGRGRTPVDGLTRPTDFLPGLDRPLSNGSDVFFLSSRLIPGDQLRAVLAHEWCHAAAFSRRGRFAAEEIRPAQDDWLNEATAHLVEVRASGSNSNVAHRIRHFLANPGQSPLVVRDYCQPEFWRHDGCRGAGYLFLASCLRASDDKCLNRLVNHDRPGLAGLEATMGQSFERLFAHWTSQLGRHLASNGATAIPGVTRDNPGSEPMLAHQTWRLSGQDQQTMTLRVRASCVEFVRVEVRDETTWELALSATGVDAPSLQTNLIPVSGKSLPRQ